MCRTVPTGILGQYSTVQYCGCTQTHLAVESIVRYETGGFITGQDMKSFQDLLWASPVVESGVDGTMVQIQYPVSVYRIYHCLAELLAIQTVEHSGAIFKFILAYYYCTQTSVGTLCLT